MSWKQERLTVSEPTGPPPPADGALVAVVVHLSGPHRGLTQRLTGARLRIGAAPEAEVRLGREESGGPPPVAATLHRRGLTNVLEVEPGQAVWVNGRRVQRTALASGDVIEVGRGGSVLRFRLHDAGAPYKSLAEAFADCVDCARYGGRSWLGRAAILLAAMPVELATQTSRLFRVGVVLVLALFIGGAAVLLGRSVALERQVTRELSRIAGLVTARTADGAVSDIDDLRDEVTAGLAGTAERMEALEARSRAPGRVIRAATGSTLLLLGAFAYADSGTGTLFRYFPGPGGEPSRHLSGEPILTTTGDGPVLETTFSGTGFVAASDGLVLTSRHVAQPWVGDRLARLLLSRGARPTMRRFVAYLPGVIEPYEVEVVAASAAADLAAIRVAGLGGRVAPLPLAAGVPSPGDEVVVLGYPLGVRALLARAPPEFVEEVIAAGDTSLWRVAERLSRGGHIAPLATRGIVGQVAERVAVYDAETTRGASGGPVLTLDGRVVAVNAGGLPQFGGSNFGVPVAVARALLRRVERR